GTLRREERRHRRAIEEADIARKMATHVRGVLVDVRRVHDDHVPLRREAIDDDVVDDRAAFVREQAVARLAGLESGDVAGHEPIEGRARAGALEIELAHVREIEEAGRVPHGAMLRDDARVLDRHLPPRERHQLRAELAVLLEEWGPLERGLGGHAARATSRARSRISRYVS